MRKSILKRTAFLSVIAILLASTISWALFVKRNLDDVKASCYTSMTVAADTAQMLLENVPYETLTSPTSAEYEHLRNEVRDVSKSLGILYIELYEWDDSKDVDDTLLSVSCEDDLDEKERQEILDGNLYDGKITERQRRAYNGEDVTDPDTTDYNGSTVYTWYRLINNPGSKGKMMIAVDYRASTVLDAVLDSTLAYAVPMTVLLLLLVVGEVALFKFNVFDPISEISRRMRDFVREDERNPEPLKVRRNDEIGEIAESFNKMATDIDDHVILLEKITEERVAQATELGVARDIQLGLVPPITSRVGNGYDAFAFERAAKAVGGDFYDVMETDAGTLLLTIADVSGKGVSAALFMAMARTLINSKLKQSMDPAQALIEANDEISANNPTNMFVTMFAGVFDPATGVLTYANAGHMPPLVVGGDYLKPNPGLALGLFEGEIYVNETIVLEPGMGLLLYTDGVTEPTNGESKPFGEKKLREAVASASGAQETVRMAIDSVDNFVRGLEQFDDLTMVAIFATKREA